MNPKQRRGLLLMIISAVVAVAVFVGVVMFVQNVSSQVGPTTEVYVAKEDIAAYQPIKQGMLETKTVPNRYMTPDMVTSLEQIAGQKASVNISAGSFIQTNSIQATSSIGDGQREIAVTFAGDAGVSGRVAPGDKVDVVASFARARENDQGETSYKRADIPYNVSGIIVSDATVVSVGQPVDPNAVVGAADETGAETEAVSVTFAVSVAEANRLSYAEAFAISMRVMRIGNNETGTKVNKSDKTFDDRDLQGTINGGGRK